MTAADRARRLRDSALTTSATCAILAAGIATSGALGGLLREPATAAAAPSEIAAAAIVAVLAAIAAKALRSGLDRHERLARTSPRDRA